MDHTTWQRAKQVFHEALEKDGQERDRFVAAACGADSALKAQVEGLLAAHAEAGEFLASPTGGGNEPGRVAASVFAAGPPEGPGTRIGPYKLLQLIGEGGFGVVYMAEQQEPIRRRVALKIVKLGMDTREVIARFEAERQALALMDHPNIARVLDAGATDSGRPFFVMELVRGVPITEYSEANRLSTRQRLELFVDLCRALHHAHEKGVVHRDIKPSNVMVTLHDDTPVVKVIDFGVSKAMNQPLTEKTLFTAYGQFVGTPTYMSPEQAALGGLEIDRRCDVYALGVLLYELLTGATPFDTESLRSRAFLEIMRMIREDDPPTPSARLTTLGDRLTEVARRRQVEPNALTRLLRGDLDWIVTKAMEKDRRRRYDSAADLASDLTRYFSDKPVTARRPTTAYRLRKFARRRKGSLIVATGIAGAIVLGGALVQLGAGPSNSEASLPVIAPRLSRIIGSDTLEIVDAALSPDSRWVVFSTNAPEDRSALWVIPAQGGTPTPLVDVFFGAEPTWLPSGDRIAYWAWPSDSEMGGIMTVPFDGATGRASGSPKRVTVGPAVWLWYRISPDGQWIAYRRQVDSLRIEIAVAPADGGTGRTVYVSDGKAWLVDWSADGRYIYFWTQVRDSPQARRTFRVSVEGGAAEEVLEPPTGASAPNVPYWLSAASKAESDASQLEMRTYDGAAVARIALPQGVTAPKPGRGLSSDGRRLLSVVSASVASARVVPVTGATPRELGEVRADESALGWSADGASALVATPIQGRQVIMSVPVAGGAAREIGPVPDRGPLAAGDRGPIVFSADGRSLAYSRPTPGQPVRTLVVRPIGGGEERVVTRSLFSMNAVGPGGTPHLAGADFLYLELRGDEVELRATPPVGSSRLLRSFPLKEATDPIGVFGNRVAYGSGTAATTGDPGIARIAVADGPDGIEEEVAAVPNVLAFGDIVWSPDGRWLAATAYVGTTMLYGYRLEVLVVGVSPDGKVSSPARLIDTPIIDAAWGLQWLPDGSAVVVTGQSPPTARIDVWLVPVHNGRPVALTSAEQDAIGGDNVLSPDGRYVMYQARVRRGSSLWLADLGDALSRIGSR